MKLPPEPGMEKIEHIVILMMENRSFDHYLGALSFDEEYPAKLSVDGLPSPLPSVLDENGTPVTAWNLETRPECVYMGYPDLPHGPGPQVSNHTDDAFVKNYEAQIRKDMTSAGSTQGEIDAAIARDGTVPMGFYTRKTLPVLYSLADNFTVCDKWFSSVLSSTWPNRKYLHSGVRDADPDTHTLPAFPGFLTTPMWSVVKREFQVSYSTVWLSRRLAALNWSVQLPVARALEQDDELVEAWLQHDWPRIKKKLADKVR